VFPGLTVDDVTNKRFAHVESLAEFGLGMLTGRVQSTDRFDLFCREFGTPMLFSWTAMRNPQNSYGMSNVFCLRDPLQVFKAIVRFVAVFVVSDHPWRAWANKGFKDEDVDESLVSLPFIVETQTPVSLFSNASCINMADGKFCSLFDALNLPYIADCIGSIEFFNLLPLLCHHASTKNANATRSNLRLSHGKNQVAYMLS